MCQKNLMSVDFFLSIQGVVDILNNTSFTLDDTRNESFNLLKRWEVHLKVGDVELDLFF